MRVFLATIAVLTLFLEIAGHHMTTSTGATAQSTTIVANDSTTAAVTSKDGTAIGYRQLAPAPAP
jgi:hypothetical protein